MYLAQQKGLFFAIDARTGKTQVEAQLQALCRFVAAVGRKTVYQGYMDFVDCPQGRTGASGFVIAMNTETGKRRWIYRAGPVESSPLLRNGVLYVGSWDHKVYAITRQTGSRKKWSFQADDEALNTSAAYSDGRIFIASDGGSLYALNAGTGKLALAGPVQLALRLA